jgi:hypothetical protein
MQIEDTEFEIADADRIKFEKNKKRRETIEDIKRKGDLNDQIIAEMEDSYSNSFCQRISNFCSRICKIFN